MHGNRETTKPPSLKQQAYSALLEQILDGRLSPGMLLNRRGVAETLGMSAAPVHEAMLQLETHGFLEALPRVGTRVKTVSREEVRGHLVLREALECQAARMIRGEPVTRAFPYLVRLARAVDTAGAALHVRALREVAFHTALLDLTNCPVLIREYQRVVQIGLFYRINRIVVSTPDVPPIPHVDLLEAHRGADPARVDALVRAHIWSGKPGLSCLFAT